MLNAELLQLRIGVRALVKRVSAGGVVAGSNASAADRHAKARWPEEFREQGASFLLVQFAEQVARRVCERSAESQDLLVAFCGIQLNGGRAVGRRRAPLRHCGLLKFLALGSGPGLHASRRRRPEELAVKGRK